MIPTTIRLHYLRACFLYNISTAYALSDDQVAEIDFEGNFFSNRPNRISAQSRSRPLGDSGSRSLAELAGDVSSTSSTTRDKQVEDAVTDAEENIFDVDHDKVKGDVDDAPSSTSADPSSTRDDQEDITSNNVLVDIFGRKYYATGSDASFGACIASALAAITFVLCGVKTIVSYRRAQHVAYLQGQARFEDEFDEEKEVDYLLEADEDDAEMLMSKAADEDDAESEMIMSLLMKNSRGRRTSALLKGREDIKVTRSGRMSSSGREDKVTRSGRMSSSGRRTTKTSPLGFSSIGAPRSLRVFSFFLASFAMALMLLCFFHSVLAPLPSAVFFPGIKKKSTHSDETTERGDNGAAGKTSREAENYDCCKCCGGGVGGGGCSSCSATRTEEEDTSLGQGTRTSNEKERPEQGPPSNTKIEDMHQHAVDVEGQDLEKEVEVPAPVVPVGAGRVVKEVKFSASSSTRKEKSSASSSTSSSSTSRSQIETSTFLEAGERALGERQHEAGSWTLRAAGCFLVFSGGFLAAFGTAVLFSSREVWKAQNPRLEDVVEGGIEQAGDEDASTRGEEGRNTQTCALIFLESASSSSQLQRSSGRRSGSFISQIGGSQSSFEDNAPALDESIHLEEQELEQEQELEGLKEQHEEQELQKAEEVARRRKFGTAGHVMEKLLEEEIAPPFIRAQRGSVVMIERVRHRHCVAFTILGLFYTLLAGLQLLPFHPAIHKTGQLIAFGSPLTSTAILSMVCSALVTFPDAKSVAACYCLGAFLLAAGIAAGLFLDDACGFNYGRIVTKILGTRTGKSSSGSTTISTLVMPKVVRDEVHGVIHQLSSSRCPLDPMMPNWNHHALQYCLSAVAAPLLLLGARDMHAIVQRDHFLAEDASDDVAVGATG
ncbi:unnamed protein product [Amoebophrya sp. A25]|nr:unnamed protein product [Amoebophrya sp. A25]|eukprot:GSA25T00002998001.1